MNAYIERTGLRVADIYYKGIRQTGCMFCGFGAQFADDKRLQLLYENYPKWYARFMEYENRGTTYREALRQILELNGLHLPDEPEKVYWLPKR